jgi:predicted nucleic-acid-binding Zn-ribbon protein
LIKYLKCPKCGNRFYIMEEFANKGHTWFCPQCRLHFKESESVEEVRDQQPEAGTAKSEPDQA